MGLLSRLKNGEGNAVNAMVPAEKPIHQDRMEQAQRLALRHIRLQARQLASELEVELWGRAKAAATESQELAKQCRLDVQAAISGEERRRRLQERHDHESRTHARAQCLEWATAAERLHQQDSIAKRRFEAGQARDTERARQTELRRQHEAALEARQKAHELALQKARELKAAEYDAKIARINCMEARRGEILDEMARARKEACNRYEELKALAYSSAVQNDDDLLRRLLEELVPRLLSIPHTKRGSFHRATSAGPCCLEAPRGFSGDESPYSPRSPRESARSQSARPAASRSSSAPGSPASRSGSLGSCARKLGGDSPRKCCPVDMRLVGIGGAARRPISPGAVRKRNADKAGSDSRSTSAASSGTTSGLFSSSYGSASWESMSLPSPVGPQVSKLIASARNEPLATVPDTPIDCAYCYPLYTTPRRPQRGIDIATYAKIARGVPARQAETSEQPAGA